MRFLVPFVLLGLPVVLVAASPTVNFNRDVRPVLAKHCFTCHGPDENAREAGLRLDTQIGSREDLGGYAAVQPNSVDASELIQRVTSDDADLRMPPADSHPPLTDHEIQLLKEWIAAGGDYETHWAFVAPDSVQVPFDVDDEWSRNAIDRFVRRRMQTADLEPAPRANRAALIRRLYLDLLGLTPTPEAVDRFTQDDDPAAYQRLVDRLLASPDYAERFARPWLDLARYSDTNGYEKDRPRTIWPYRDWVINAIASDMPFDQFTIEQLAGDMLPGATRDQQIATGFNRNTMLNEEGGIDPLEYRFYAMVDRVATVGTVWLGLTTGCAQCHTHKYDPLTHTDYYAMMALLDNANEPEVVVPDAEREAKKRLIESQVDREVDSLVDRFLNRPKTEGDEAVRTAFEAVVLQQREQEELRWQTPRPNELKTTLPRLSVLDDGSILASGDVTKRDVFELTFDLQDLAEPLTALRLTALPHESLPAGGPGMAFYEGRRGDFFLSEINVKANGSPIKLKEGSHSFGKISVGSGNADAGNVFDGDGSTGWSTSGKEGQSNHLVVNFDESVTEGVLKIELVFERHFAAALGHFRIEFASGDKTAQAVLIPGLTLADEGSLRALKRQFVLTSDAMKKHRKPIERLQAEIPEEIRTLGMLEREPADARTTHRHHRGEYLQAKESVAPAVPVVFERIESGSNRAPDRLSFARWLVSDKNVLVGRVSANRAWRHFFGTGIVRTAGDFGTQSEPPSHPRLIDFLDQQLRRGGWSLKRLHREIVLSATYQQRVGHGPESDPGNRLLSRFPYRRLDAERIRDAMLSAADLLTKKWGGPSVYPPQPDAISKMAYGSPAWNTSSGGDRYRRSLYTFSKRTAPFAAFATFDGPSGETCAARRDSSTTPLQALTLMNDAMYLEIAQGLAEATLRDVGSDAAPKTIVQRLFRRLLGRKAEPGEIDALMEFYESQIAHEEPWTLVARALMNTDEAITVP
ncbi:DUF1553 domain-containing protein [Stieleria marina]|uniref:DUF1553 domain-containing protein n=1 Tax=Stieleria marina TaxID=1930275 RepID=UPI003AF356E5